MLAAFLIARAVFLSVWYENVVIDFLTKTVLWLVALFPLVVDILTAIEMVLVGIMAALPFFITFGLAVTVVRIAKHHINKTT